MSSIWNSGIKLSVFGESHSKAIGVVLDNIPAGEYIDLEKIMTFLARRRAKSDGTTTPRIEADLPNILCGVHDGTTNGTPICIVIENTNTRSKDYAGFDVTPRPSHADYTGKVRYNSHNDFRGGGHFSARLTACLVAAGAICAQILGRKGIEVVSHLYSVKDIFSSSLPNEIDADTIDKIRSLPFPFIDEEKRQKAIDLILNASKEHNSVGGITECVCYGMPVGIGSPIFDNLESIIASMMFSIPGVKGVEFGSGFGASSMLGSEHNDDFYMKDGKVLTKTNNHGGIIGGISSGMPIRFKVAFKPTPSIALEQNTVNLSLQKDSTISIVGRHDPCIAVRGTCVVEACTNIAILSAILSQN